MYYYRDLTEFKHTLGFLVGTMQSAQDVYEAWIKYFDEDLLEGLNVELVQSINENYVDAIQNDKYQRRI